MTIPASQLRESDGQLYAPRWLLMRTIHERVLDRKRWPHDIEHGQFLDADMLWAELFAPLQLALEQQEAVALERKRQRKAWDATYARAIKGDQGRPEGEEAATHKE